MQNENQTSHLSGSRCHLCRKKTLILTKCACEVNYCLTCRYPDVHKCTFDFKEQAKKTLEKNNPLIAGEKLVKI